jgi:HPt (histidine-containing phosphotransfer) domain-containing protein
MVDVLLKPISEKDLIHCLQKHLGLKDNNDTDIPTDISPSPNKQNTVKDIFKDDPLISDKMTAIFLDSIKNALIDFETGLKKGELSSVRKTAHKIIPSCRHMGFDQFALKLKELENSIEDGNTCETVNEQLTIILQSANEVIESVEKFDAATKAKNK